MNYFDHLKDLINETIYLNQMANICLNKIVHMNHFVSMQFANNL